MRPQPDLAEQAAIEQTLKQALGELQFQLIVLNARLAAREQALAQRDAEIAELRVQLGEAAGGP